MDNEYDHIQDDARPRPGMRLDSQKEKRLYQSFYDAFRCHEPGGIPTTVGTYMTFKNRRFVGEDILRHPRLKNQDSVYFLVEGHMPRPRYSGHEVYKATMYEVRNYLFNMDPWDYDNMYVFDYSLKWCIAITHEEDVYLQDEYGYFE